MSRKLRNHAFAALDAARRDSGSDRAFTLNRRRLIEVPVEKVRPNPHQPRKTFRDEDIESLAASIERFGLQEPILIQEVPGEPDEWQLIAGERRLRAHELLGRAYVEAIVTSGDAREIALVENLLRVDLNPFEMATAIAGLADENGYTHEDLSVICGRNRSEITRLIGLTRLPAEIRREYEEACSDISVSILFLVAEAGEEDMQRRLWDRAKEGMTVRQLRAIKNGGAPAPDVVTVTPAAPANDVKALTRALRTFDRRVAEVSPDRLTPDQKTHLRRLRERIDILLAE